MAGTDMKELSNCSLAQYMYIYVSELPTAKYCHGTSIKTVMKAGKIHCTLLSVIQPALTYWFQLSSLSNSVCLCNKFITTTVYNDLTNRRNYDRIF